MVRASTEHAVGILTEFLQQCGGAQGALLELKYGHFEKQFDRGTALRELKDQILRVQKDVTAVLEDVR